jgi:hypothetical protein
MEPAGREPIEGDIEELAAATGGGKTLVHVTQR